MKTTRSAAVLAGLTLAASVVPSASATPAPATATAPSQGSGATQWDVPDASVTASTAGIASRADSTKPVSVLLARKVGDHDMVVTSEIAAPGQLRAAIARAQHTKGALAVSIGGRAKLADRAAATPRRAAFPTTALAAAPAATTAAAMRYSDPLRSSLWGLTTLKAEQVYARQKTGGILIATVDTGVDYGHPDLAGRLVGGARCMSPSETSLKPCVATNAADDHGHGTHVAGILAANANNGRGVAGMAPDAKIMAVKVFDPEGYGNDGDVINGMLWAADHGAKIINMSLTIDAAYGTNAVALKAIQHVIQDKGALPVAAAGNDGQRLAAEYPASYAGVLGVGSVDNVLNQSFFSNSGPFVDVVAPGENILSTWPHYLDSVIYRPTERTGYDYDDGTSMATPYVAASAAILKAAKPSLTPAQLTSLLTSKAVDRGAAGRDDLYGYGVVNPLASLCAVVSCAAAAPPIFIDVPTNEPFHSYIYQLAALGVTTGYTAADGSRTYHPYASITRGEMMTFLVRLAGSPAFTPPTTSPFADVKPTDPFYKQITQAYASGLATGWRGADGKLYFRPKQSVNRDTMAAFLYRYAGKPAYTAPAKSPFADVKPTSPFYREICWLASKGISTGWYEADGTRTYRPLQPVLRDQMAAFLIRLKKVA